MSPGLPTLLLAIAAPALAGAAIGEGCDDLTGTAIVQGVDWTRDIKQAELIEDEAVAQDRLIFAMSQFDTVVGAYLADVKATEDGPTPTHFREDFRTRGPSNYPHGKQAGV